MKNSIDSNFAIAIVALVAACVGFSFWLNVGVEGIKNIDTHVVTSKQEVDSNHNIFDHRSSASDLVFSENGLYTLIYFPEDREVALRERSREGIRDNIFFNFYAPIGPPHQHARSSFYVSSFLSGGINPITNSAEYLEYQDQLIISSPRVENDQVYSLDFLERRVFEKDNRSVFSEEYKDGNLRCIYFGERLDKDYILVFSQCGTKILLNPGRLNLMTNEQLLNELAEYEIMRIERTLQMHGDESGELYYVHQGTIRKYIEQDSSEEILRSDVDVNYCERIGESFVLACTSHSYEYYSSTSLYFIKGDVLNNMDDCWTTKDVVQVTDDGLIEVKCLEGESTYSGVSENDVFENRYYDESGQIVRKSANNIDLCKDEPIKSDTGEPRFPVDIKYRHLPYLGELFTASACGDERIAELSSVKNGIYTLGSKIYIDEWFLDQFEDQSLKVELLLNTGYHCDEELISQCKQWSLNTYVEADKLVELESLYYMIEKDECVNCN